MSAPLAILVTSLGMWALIFGGFGDQPVLFCAGLIAVIVGGAELWDLGRDPSEVDADAGEFGEG